MVNIPEIIERRNRTREHFQKIGLPESCLPQLTQDCNYLINKITQLEADLLGVMLSINHVSSIEENCQDFGKDVTQQLQRIVDSLKV